MKYRIAASELEEDGKTTIIKGSKGEFQKRGDIGNDGAADYVMAKSHLCIPVLEAKRIPVCGFSGFFVRVL